MTPVSPKNPRSEPMVEIAGYGFEKPSLLAEALTHPSLDGRLNYQRFEFLGDRVLGLVIAEWLLDHFPGENEGQLNRRLSSLVRRETLAERARALGFDKALKLMPGAETEGARTKEAVQADVCEAVLGAIYLDSGYEAARAFIRRHWAGLLEKGPAVTKDAKTRLQEFAQGRGWSLPEYRQLDRTGPDHDPVFTIEVVLGDRGAARAEGPAKRVAEQAAAEVLLTQLEKARI
ncbi:ribonuclease III [Eilatimonas milleporae]|uniref:Ribonuclease 3 n=1 Tax=Eilatimonas milleporae TaxID=911205 RepID=A0A3M0C6W3_9PROT|nr:ribonuclease III [Eilatimonas milleporae]RMB04427.1 RNAse III [Eilatimonas milleporae]